MALHKTGIQLAGIIVIFTLCMFSISFAAEDDHAWEERYQSEPYITVLKEVSIKINADYSFTESTHIIEKIQHEAGKDRGEITVDYDQSRQEIKDLEAYIIMPDGTKRQYEKIQEINPAGSSGIYSDNRIKVITMPNVVVGSVIEWKATIVTKKPIIENSFYDSFRFSCFCPVKEARYTITAPKDMKLNFKNLNNEIKPTVLMSENEVTYIWRGDNFDKDEDEQNMPSPEERYKRLTVSTLDNWKQLSAWVWPLFDKNIKVSTEMKKKATELTFDKKTVPEKIQAVIQYIQDNVRYVAMHIEFHGFEPHPADQIFSNKYGDCKDQTILAIAILSEIGIKARPVFLSTQSELNRRDLLPMPFYFDHVILTFDLEGKKYYTDMLFKGYPVQQIPPTLAGKGAFIVNEQGGEFATIPLTDDSEVATIINGKVLVKEDVPVSVDLTVTFPRSWSVIMREGLKAHGSDDREKFLAALGKSIAEGGTVFKADLINENVPYSQMTLAMKFDDPTIVQKAGDMMLFGLPPIKRGKLFTAPKRRYPIIVSQESRMENTIDFCIPDGYETVSVPIIISIDTAFGTYTRNYSTQGSKIIAKEIIRYKRVRIPVGEYQKVQQFLDDISKLTTDKIVIKKKTKIASVTQGKS